MDMPIRLHGRQDLTGQIYRQLRAGIVDGRLAGGQRLPSTRELAKQLGVSRKTTLEVFERLIAEGYLRTHAGDGTFVADGLTRVPQNAQEAAARAPIADADDLLLDVQPVWSDVPESLSMPVPRPALRFDFLGGVTDKTQFPFDAWRRAFNHALRIQATSRGNYRDPAGEQELRLAIARYVAFSRAVACNWQDVIVTQGAQQALDLLARVCIKPGDVAAVEDPGYPPARAAFAALGAKVAGVRVDAQGLVVADLPKDARLVYVTPAHQFPLGMPMALERRVELLEWAQRRRAVIIEDDYDSEFRFEGRPMESLKSLDRTGLVAYVGTFSKTIFPELRVGYAIPPRSLNPALQKAKQIGDWHTATLTQTALARFMLDGDFARHLRRIRKQYEARRSVLVAHLSGELARWLEPLVPAAGIHMSALLKDGIEEGPLIAAAAEASIGLYGISAFYASQPAKQGLLFGYGGMSAEEIDAALKRLAKVMRGNG
ncbi:MocR-like pyridoxine biosynthesis transcription factor PdxR [Trinickia mobilis]|uniref:MocR-like pyridoxine biosynthesis transcription factor PdxR n=1 Tax=Trinickia mobilis TaxID=2816356 RepID=UPI001A8E5CFE|nr:PLP-dependent aminotransferase family protein [Trinickia mobilis]